MAMRANANIGRKIRATFHASTAFAFIFAGTAIADETFYDRTNTLSESIADNIEIVRFSIQEDVAMDHFVAAVDDDLFIAIALPEAGASQEDSQRLVVYLCDGRTVSEWLVEDALTAEMTLIQEETRVELSVADSGVSGTVAIADAEPQQFLAELATGNAGLFRAEWTLAGAHYMINWIVLADGSQRGSLDGKGNDVSIMVPW